LVSEKSGNLLLVSPILPEVAGHVVPSDVVVILVVEDGQARLVVELLRPI
jgi:hypothetical protein